MESLIEKITLYDILGYFIPGSLFLCLLVFGTLPEFLKLTLDISNECMAYVGFVLVVFSYVFGIAISTIARWGCSLIRWICKTLPFVNIDIKVESDTIESALIKSGVSKSEIDLQKKELGVNKGKSVALIKAFSTRVYADIQTDTDYKRIHNYASSEAMYKNLAFACWSGAVIPYVLKKIADLQINSRMNLFCVFEIILGIIFLFRWNRFYRKKVEYTWYWFVKKYSN